MKSSRSYFYWFTFGIFSLPILGWLGTQVDTKSQVHVVNAAAKTDDVATKGDAADDSCIYINQNDSSKSLVIGTDKKSGLGIYDLSGKRVQDFPDGKMNNVDIRYGFPLNNSSLPLIAANNRTTNTIDFYYVDQTSNLVNRLDVGTHNALIEAYGSCMYQNKISKKYYVFVTSKTGEIAQFEISSSDSKLKLEKVRSLKVDSKSEACTVDDDLNKLYVAEEAVGIWQFNANVDSGEERKLIDKVSEGGHLIPDVEGLAIYRLQNNEGYLLASSQGENSFNIYDRVTGNFLGKFQVSYNGHMIENTDGIDITSHDLGTNFPFGMIVVQDGNKTHDKQSFKFVSWNELAIKFSPSLKRTVSDPILPLQL